MSGGNGVIGALLVSLGIDTAAFDTGVDQAKAKASAFGTAMSSLGTVAMAGLVSAVAVAGAAFVKFGGDALTSADDIGDAAARIGIGAEAYQKLGIAATAAGGTPQLMTEALDKLNENIGAFVQNGGGKAADAFKQLGLASQIASRDIGTADQAFYAIAAQMEKIEDPAVKARLATQLFGKAAGPDMLEVLAAGSDALKGYGEAAQESGRIMSDEMVEKLAAAKLALDNTTTAAGQMATVMAGQVIIAIVDMAKEMSPLWEQMKALHGQVVEFLMPSIRELGQTFITFAQGPAGQLILGMMGALAKLLGETVVSSVRLTIGVFNGLFKTLDAVGRFLEPIINKIGQAFTWLKPIIQRIVNVIAPATQGFKFMATEVSSTVPPMIQGVGQAFSKLPSVMTNVATAETGKTAKAFQSMKDSVTKVLETLFPEKAAEATLLNTYRIQVDALKAAMDAGRISAEEYTEGLRRAMEQRDAITEKPLTLGKRDDVEIDTNPQEPEYYRQAGEMRDAMKNAWQDVGQIGKNVLIDVIQTGKVNWRDLMTDVVNNWDSVGKTISNIFSSAKDIFGGGGFFGGGGGSGGGFFGSMFKMIGSIFGLSPGFAQGGTVGIKGGGGTDSRLFSAWVSPDEIIKIGQREDVMGGGYGGGRPYFDLRGAVMTTDLLSRMNSIGEQSAYAGMSGGQNLSRIDRARDYRRRME